MRALYPLLYGPNFGPPLKKPSNHSPGWHLRPAILPSGSVQTTHAQQHVPSVQFWHQGSTRRSFSSNGSWGLGVVMGDGVRSPQNTRRIPGGTLTRGGLGLRLQRGLDRTSFVFHDTAPQNDPQSRRSVVRGGLPRRRGPGFGPPNFAVRHLLYQWLSINNSVQKVHCSGDKHLSLGRGTSGVACSGRTPLCCRRADVAGVQRQNIE